MSNEFIPVFNKNTTIEVCEPLLNSYGFDLTDQNLIGFTSGKLKFTILGFRLTTNYDTLIATVKVSLNPHIHDEYVHVQKIDLYIHDRVDVYCRAAASRLRLNIDEVKKELCSLRERLERYRIDQLKNASTEDHQISISVKEQKEALEILRSDNLMDCMEGLLKEAGLVTEIENGLRLFMILLSRHFEKPLHVLLQGSVSLSRMLTDTLTSTIPINQLHEQTSMSPSSIYYTKNKNYWKNKVVSIGNIDKSFKGAATIKEFINHQVLKRYTTDSDYITRQIYSNIKIVEGNICLLGYSDNDSLNAKFFQECFLIRVDENSTNKTEMLIHSKKESAGLIDIEKQNTAKRMLMVIQHLINPIQVVIPFAMEIDIPEQVFQPLRGFNQLLTFIKTVTLLHQHQLKKKKDVYGTEYIEATPEHFEIAIELFKSILITQSDILSPSQRTFLESLKSQVKEKENRFKLPEMMQLLKMKRTSFYRDFEVLKELKYVVAAGGNKKTGIEYRIDNWDDYTELQHGIDILDEQLKKVKSQVSQKNPRSFPKVKEEQR